jgi:hypothetical protein
MREARAVEKIDLFREHRDEYAMSREPILVTVGSGKYLTVTGSGSPQDPAFQEKLGSLYGAAYTIKFDSKLRRGRDFKVGVLEGLWWVNGRRADALSSPKTSWRWKLLIRVPGFVTASSLAKARATLREKGRPSGPVKLETLREGPSVQALHVGAYGDEPRTLEKMDAFARDRRLAYRGKHHEIYLSDPRRVPAARLRTILRHPVTMRRKDVRT